MTGQSRRGNSGIALTANVRVTLDRVPVEATYPHTQAIMQFSVHAGQPLELGLLMSNGDSITLNSPIRNDAKMDITTIEFQLPHRKFGIHIEFNAQSRLALLKIVLQNMLVPTGGSFSFNPHNFHSFTIYDCGNRYEFHRNDFPVMQDVKCPYRTGLDRIAYRVILHNYASAFSNPLGSGEATTLIPNDMDGRDDETNKPMDDGADTEVSPNPDFVSLEGSGIDGGSDAERTLGLRESILAQREKFIDARERDLAERERKVAEREQELLFTVQRTSSSGKGGGKAADRKLDSNCRNQ